MRRRRTSRQGHDVDVLHSSFPTLHVVRRSDSLDATSSRRLSRAVASGEWVRVAPGAYALASEWSRLLPIERHRVVVNEVARRVPTPAVYSHFAAAAEQSIDILGHWPVQVDQCYSGASGARSAGMIRRRLVGVDAPETITWGRHRMTTPAQTALDLARILPHIEAVAVLDQAVWIERPGGALTTVDEIADLADASSFRRGTPRALRAVAACELLAANVRESQARVVISALGFPAMRLQERRILPSGRLVYGDLYMPEVDHWIEIDGRGKYVSAEYTRGRTTAEVVLDEKQRENEIRRVVRGFSRLDARDPDNPRRVYDILTSDGLRATKPRP